MDQSVVLAHLVVDFHAEIPLDALLGLVLLPIPLPFLILGRASSRDKGCIDDRSLLLSLAVRLDVRFHCLKDLMAASLWVV